jgi:hypothetical protein
MKIGVAIRLTAVLSLLFVLAACASITPTPEPINPEAIYTAAAQTVEARLTLSAGETAVAQLTTGPPPHPLRLRPSSPPHGWQSGPVSPRPPTCLSPRHRDAVSALYWALLVGMSRL